MLNDSSIVKTIYGTDKIPKHAWIQYAHALMMVAGADGHISDLEMAWLEYDFARIVQAPPEFRQQIRGFRSQEYDLNEVLQRVARDFPINYQRALVYDAIKMSMADNELHDMERDKAREAADLLQVPIYIARTIEGLVNTEQSVGDIRRSIFEVEERVKAQPNPISANSWAFKNIFGLSQLPQNMHLYYGYALMAIAGADGEVSEAERDWYVNEFAPAVLTPPDVMYRVLDFDYAQADLKEIVEQIQGELTGNFAKMLLYHAIQMARADGEYAEEERQHVERVADELGIPPDIAQTIQYLVDTEERIAKMRKTLFKAA
jgi:uncharacterized tellurite resistance protein B-like protein